MAMSRKYFNRPIFEWALIQNVHICKALVKQINGKNYTTFDKPI